MAIQTPSSLRMSGINSGLDTEAIVEAMTASTKLKINNEQRKVLKLEAQQTAYRDIISAVTEFKDKYFDILKKTSCLKSTSLFNEYKTTTVKADGTEGTPAGITITASSNAIVGSYDFEILNKATQTKVTAGKLDANQNMDLTQYNKTDQTYAMSITVGGKSQVITFEGGDEQAVKDNINNSLKEAFGETNQGDGMVKLDDTNKLVSASKSQITSSTAIELNESVSFATDFETGRNSITITIGGESKSFNLLTVDDGYFNDIFETDVNGDLVLDDDGKAKFKEIPTGTTEEEKIAAAEMKAAQDAFKGVVNDLYRQKYEAEYTKWAEEKSVSGAWSSGDYNNLSTAQKEMLLVYTEQINNDNAQKQFDAAVKKDYGKEYEEYAGQFPEDDPDNQPLEFNEWLEAEKGVTLEAFKDGSLTAGLDEEDTSALKKAYETYEKQYNTLDPADENFLDDMKLVMSAHREKDVFVALYKNNKMGDLGHDVDQETFEDFYNKFANDPLATANAFNENSFKGLNDVTFKDGTKLEMTWDVDAGGNASATLKAYKNDEDGNRRDVELAVTSESGYDFGFEKLDFTTNTVSTSTTLGSLGSDLSSFEFTINGVDFSFDKDTTIQQMLNTVTNSTAGVTMKFSSLNNEFSFTSKDYGTGVEIEYSDKISEDDQDNGITEGFLSRLGFNQNETTVEAGTNMRLMVNNEEVIETAGNSFTLDGVTITVASNANISQSFSTDVSRDFSNAISSIKSFVEDYNKLIEKVYEYVDEKPNKDYYFLTDDDKTDMDLTDKQIEMWEKVANKGVLYNDSLISGMMGKFRSAFYASTTTADGKTFGLVNMGITSSAEYWKHGTLSLNEDELAAAFNTNADDIMKLFTDPDKGIMANLDKLIESYTKTTGARADKGLLVQKAGMGSGTSANDNGIADLIKKAKTTISTLESRYEKQQDRYWKIFSAMETQMGALNNQTSYISQMMGGM